MKKFKTGKYYIFNKNGKKIGKVKIHALVEIDDILHAVFTYYTDVTKHVHTLPIEIEGETQTIHFNDARWYLNAAAPVSLMPAKFKVGKEYFYRNNEGFDEKIYINTKYKDPADMQLKVVFDLGVISEVHTDEDGNEILNAYRYKVSAINEVKE